jgi:periplasmic mercuric ion binding protein
LTIDLHGSVVENFYFLIFQIITLNIFVMKTIKFIGAAILAAMISLNTFAQKQDNSKSIATKTETIKISGNCDLCESKIEKAAKLEGVSKADWNQETKVLTLVYDPSKVKSDDVQKKIAAAGYDTEKYKADDKAYNTLPGCCKYR